MPAATGGRRRDRFRGRIAGVGSSSGLRAAVGHWTSSPLGSFTDVMVERADGHRILLAPTEEVAAYVTSTYTFDEVRVEPVTCRVGADTWRVESPSMSLILETGTRTTLGRLLRIVPKTLATQPFWSRTVGPLARVLVPGVRTVGVAREGRREYYGATDLHAVTSMTGSFDGTSLGELRDIDPPCRFGFSSTPRTPSVTTVVTTVEHATA